MIALIAILGTAALGWAIFGSVDEDNVITEDDPHAVAHMIPGVIDSLLKGRNHSPDTAKIEEFNRIHLTERLARILNDITESSHA